MRRGSHGFTLVEVLVALVLLSVGVLGALGVVAALERQLWRTRARSRAATAMQSRIAELRSIAARTDPACLDLQSGTAGQPPGPLESWVVTADGGGTARRVHASVRFTGRGDVTDSVEAVVRCE